MAITVTMIEEKEFKTKMRGYDPLEVDEFLDEICDEMVNMQEEITSLQSRLAKSGSRLFTAPAPAPAVMPPSAVPVPPAFAEPAPAPAPAKKDDAEEAARILRSAQKVYDDTVADAKREAQKILDEAKGMTQEDADLLKKRTMLEEEIAHLKEAAKQYRDRVLKLMDEQKGVLDTAGDLFDEE